MSDTRAGPSTGPIPDGAIPAGENADVPDGADKTVATILGEIVWLMSQSAEHKHYTLADLEWLVMPPILLRQFRIFYKEGQPVGAVIYARASEAVAARLALEGTRLEPAEWCSGKRVMVVQNITPFGSGDLFASQISDVGNNKIGL